MNTLRSSSRIWQPLWRGLLTRSAMDYRQGRHIPTKGILCNRSISQSRCMSAMATEQLKSHTKKEEQSDRVSVDKQYESVATLNFSQPLSDLWAEYCQRVENKGELTDQDFITLCARIKKEEANRSAIERLQSILREVHRRNMNPRTFVRGCNMLIHLFIIHNDLKSAKLVVDGMIRSNYQPDEVTVRTLTLGIGALGNPGDLHNLYNAMRENNMWPESAYAYRDLIASFTTLRDLDSARTYFAVFSQKKDLPTDDAVYNAMIEAYGAAEQPDGALSVYKQMRQANVAPTAATFHILLSILARHNLEEETLSVYRDLRNSNVEPNASHYTAMGWEPKRILEEMKKGGIPLVSRDYNTLMTDYVKRNDFESAFDIFRQMLNDNVAPDVCSYSIVMDSLVKDEASPPEAVFELYEDMKDQGIRPDVVIFTTLIAACTKGESLEKTFDVLKEMERFDILPNAFTLNALLGLLARKQRTHKAALEYAEELWDKMVSLGVSPDTRSYNILLAMLSKQVRPLVRHQSSSWMTDNRQHVPKQVQKMLSMYKRMKVGKRWKTKPDFATYSILINTLSACGQLRQAMTVYEHAKESRTPLPVTVYNGIMRSLSDAGQVTQVMNVWQDIKSLKVQPDNVSYSLALDACEQLGLTESFAAIRAQRKQDIPRLIELEQQEQERLRNATSIEDAVIDEK